MLFLLCTGWIGDRLVIPRGVLVLQGVLAFVGMVGLRLAVDMGGADLAEPPPR